MIQERSTGGLTIDYLMKMATRKAHEEHDGHFTVFSFSTGFKGAFGTINVDSGEGRGSCPC